MSFPASLYSAVSTVSPSFIFALALPALILAATYVYTTIRYRFILPKYTSPSSKPQSPPKIPYVVPFLGHSLAFLVPLPGHFWTRLVAKHPRSTGACTLMLGGQQAHVLFDPTAVQAIFKARGPTRDRFNYQVMENSMGMKRSEVKKFYGLEEPTSDEKDRDPRFESHETQYDYVLRADRMNELTDVFTRKLEEELGKDKRLNDGKELEIGLATWLRDQMLKALTCACLGKRLLEVYPELTEDYWKFDKAMMALFLGLPKFIIPEHFKARDTVLSGLQRWHEVAWEECKGQPLDPDAASWDPIYGCRLTRGRQRLYMYKGLTTQSKAASDLGIIFALSSNAIPTFCWMMLHILDPNADKTLLPRVLAELETARSDDGINVPVLVSLPLIQSIFQETLRLYTDVLVTRDVHADLALPVDEGKRQVQFRKGDLVLVPTWLGHRDEGRWNNPPHDVFYAERFLKRNPDTGKDTFTMGGAAGKLFPFGGGKTICPGRLFAKQGILSAVAMVLLNYDIQPLNFLDGSGKEIDKFPCLAKRFSGNGIIALEGDMKVRMKRRS